MVDIPLKIRTRHNFEQIDGYDNTLQQGVDFRRFFEWFRDREDAENELKASIADELTAQFSQPDFFQKKLTLGMPPDKQLESVRRAIQTFMPDFDNLLHS